MQVTALDNSGEGALWAASGAIDHDANTVYSSRIFATATNDRGVGIAAWFADKQTISHLILTARVTSGFVQAFSQSYDVYVTSEDNSRWVYLKTVSQQPGANGQVDVELNGSHTTYGVQVVPKLLGVDSYGGHYLQIAEMAALK